MPYDILHDDHEHHDHRLPQAEQHLDLTPAPAPPVSLSPQHILHLQRTIGNQGVQRWLQRQRAEEQAHGHGCGCESCGVQRVPLEPPAPLMLMDDPDAHGHGCGCATCSPPAHAPTEAAMLQRAPRQGPLSLTTDIQRGKAKKKSSRQRQLLRKIDDVIRILPPASAAAQAFLDLYGEVNESDTLAELAQGETDYAHLMHTHAAVIGLGAAPHPAGAHYCDPQGNLIAPYNVGIRGHFYPSNYQVAATNALAAYEAGNPGGAPGTVRCPGTGAIAAHDVPAGSLTIDHIVPVSQHWNAGAPGHVRGKNTTRANRIAYYNDIANHQYMCGPCNSSQGSGGVFYSTKVGPNFRN